MWQNHQQIKQTMACRCAGENAMQQFTLQLLFLLFYLIFCTFYYSRQWCICQQVNISRRIGGGSEIRKRANGTGYCWTVCECICVYVCVSMCTAKYKLEDRSKGDKLELVQIVFVFNIFLFFFFFLRNWKVAQELPEVFLYVRMLSGIYLYAL